MTQSIPDGRDISRHITTLVLTILTGLFIFISYHVLSAEVLSLLHWHVFLATGACLLFMPWAVLNINSDLSILTQPLSPYGKQLLHGILGCLAVAFAFASLICIVVFKENNTISHFKTDHSKLGLTAILTIVVVAVGGILLRLRLLPLNILKICHPFLGICALVLGLANMCIGYDTFWFYLLTNRTATKDTCITLSVISIFWVIVRPIINLLGRLRN